MLPRINRYIIAFICISIAILLYYSWPASTSTNSQTIHEVNGYRVIEYHDLLSNSECDALLEFAKTKRMDKSKVMAYNAENPTKVDDSFRKCEQVWVKKEEHPLLQKLSTLSERLSGIPEKNQDMLQIAHYTPGGIFRPHFDACNSEDKVYCTNINKGGGERKATLLVYMNDTFEGGETEFINIGVKIKPKKGMGILFYNVDDDEKIIQSSMHGGNEVLSGEKWICTVWSHMKEMNV